MHCTAGVISLLKIYLWQTKTRDFQLWLVSVNAEYDQQSSIKGVGLSLYQEYTWMHFLSFVFVFVFIFFLVTTNFLNTVQVLFSPYGGIYTQTYQTSKNPELVNLGYTSGDYFQG